MRESGGGSRLQVPQPTGSRRSVSLTRHHYHRCLWHCCHPSRSSSSCKRPKLASGVESVRCDASGLTDLCKAKRLMASPWSLGGFVKVNGGNGSSITVQITETSGLKAKGLSFATWGAAFVLSDLLHEISLPPQESEHCKCVGVDVLELGAGTGLVGISAAALWKRNVLLTDLPSILPGLAANIEINDSLLRASRASVSCGSLDWNSPSGIHFFQTDQSIQPKASTKPSVILAADTLYDGDHAPSMATTIETWLAPGPTSRAILCYPLRFAYIDCIREFWELMEANGFQCDQEGREMGRDEWNEVPGTEFEWCIWKWKDDVSFG